MEQYCESTIKQRKNTNCATIPKDKQENKSCITEYYSRISFWYIAVLLINKKININHTKALIRCHVNLKPLLCVSCSAAININI